MLLKKPPQAETIAALSAHFPEVDSSAVLPYISLLIAAREMGNAVEANLAKFRLSQGRFAALIMLWHCPREEGATPAELADHAVVSRATVSGLLDGLEAEGLVERVNRKDDRRMVRVRLTNAGVALLEKVIPAHYGRVAELMTNLNKAERKTLGKLLEKLRAT